MGTPPTAPPIPGGEDPDAVAARSPSTPPEELARIAAQRSDLHVTLAANPATYPALVDWLRQSPYPAVQAALRQRDLFGPGALDTTPLTPPPPPPQTSSHTTAPGGRSGRGPKPLVALVATGALVAVVAVAVVVGQRATYTEGESGSSDALSGDSPEPTVTETQPPQSAATPTPTPSAPLGSVTWSLESASGYTEKVSVAVGDVMTGTELEGVSFSYHSTVDGMDGSIPLDNVCSVDPDSDAVIPVTVTATSTTAGFQAYLSYTVGAFDTSDSEYVAPTSMDSADRFETANAYSGGDTSCRSLTREGAGAHWSTPVDQGGTRTDLFYVVVHDYRTPAAPDGDAPVLGLIRLIPYASSAESSVDSGGEQYAPSDLETLIALDGTTHPFG